MNVVIDGVTYVPIPAVPTGKGLLDALELRFNFEGDEITVRDYLRMLLIKVWEEEEDFNGKRPFGNSGWTYDLLLPLAVAGFVDLGELHEEDKTPYDWTDVRLRTAHAYVSDLILAMCHGVPQS